jgi:hypothetical protein
MQEKQLGHQHYNRTRCSWGNYPDILSGPGLTSSPRSPEGFRSERYENEDVLEVSGITTGADSLAGGLALVEMGGTGEEAAFGGVPELTWIKAATTATAATTLPIIVQKSVRPRRIGPPRPSCLSLGNVASSRLVISSRSRRRPTQAASMRSWLAATRRPCRPKIATESAELSVLAIKQLPVPLGYDVDGAVGHFDGGLVVDRIRRTWDAGGPFFCVGHGVLRQEFVI